MAGEGRGTYLRVGLAIVVAIGALLGLVVFLSGDRLSEGKPFESYFRESVQGLEVGAPVKYRGVTLGRVTEIGLVAGEYARDRPELIAKTDYRLVFVRYVINVKRLGRLPETMDAVAEGLRAKVAQQGITGLAYVELDFVDDPARYKVEALPWEPKADYIPSVPSTLTQVQDAAQELLARLNQVDAAGLISQVNGLISDIRQSLKDGDVHETLTRTTALLRTAEGAVREADVPGLSRSVREATGAVTGLARGREVQTLLARASEAADRFATAAAKLPPLIAALQATAQRADASTSDVQAGLGPLLRDATTAAANLRELTEGLRRYPAGALLGGAPPRAEPR